MTIECFGNNTSTTISATSQLFHIYDAPTTGLLTMVNTNFSYKGQIGVVQSVLDAFTSDMGTLTCTGCPGGKITHCFCHLIIIICFPCLGVGRRRRSAEEDNAQAFNEAWSPLH